METFKMVVGMTLERAEYELSPFHPNNNPALQFSVEIKPEELPNGLGFSLGQSAIALDPDLPHDFDKLAGMLLALMQDVLAQMNNPKIHASSPELRAYNERGDRIDLPDTAKRPH